MGTSASNTEEVVTPRIVAGAMTAVGKARFGPGKREPNAGAAYIAKCMIEATELCYKAGVHDPKRILAAKAKAKLIAEHELQRCVDVMIAKAAAAAAKLKNTPADVATAKALA